MYGRVIGRVADDMDRFTDDIRRWIDVQLRPAGARFRRVIKRSLNLPWFSYAQSLFNKSAGLTHQSRTPSPSTSTDASSFHLPPNTSTFAQFLDVYNVEEVERWHLRYSERYIKRFHIQHLGGLGGTTGSALDSRSEGRGFDSH